VGIFPYIGLKNRPNIYGIGASNQSVPEMAIEMIINDNYISIGISGSN
jgi:hypothetical protein